jgi:hypothetical protein
VGHPAYVAVPTRDDGLTRFPLVESIFADIHTQPFIHNCVVIIIEGRVVHRFHVFCKNHRRLSINTTVWSLWKGDIVVMRAGKRQVRSVVNMRGHDAGLADYAVQQYVHCSPACLTLLTITGLLSTSGSEHLLGYQIVSLFGSANHTSIVVIKCND